MASSSSSTNSVWPAALPYSSGFLSTTERVGPSKLAADQEIHCPICREPYLEHVAEHDEQVSHEMALQLIQASPGQCAHRTGAACLLQWLQIQSPTCALCRAQLYQHPAFWHTIVIDPAKLLPVFRKTWMETQWGEFDTFMGFPSRTEPFLDLLTALAGETVSLWMLWRMLCDLVLVYDATEIYELVTLERLVWRFCVDAAKLLHPTGPRHAHSQPYRDTTPVVRTVSHADWSLLITPESLAPRGDVLTSRLIALVEVSIRRHDGQTLPLQCLFNEAVELFRAKREDGRGLHVRDELAGSHHDTNHDHEPLHFPAEMVELQIWEWLSYATRKPVRLAWAAALADARLRTKEGRMRGTMVFSCFEVPRVVHGREIYQWRTLEADEEDLPTEGRDLQWNLRSRMMEWGWEIVRREK